MARLPRLTLPGFPHHIIQRGNNRQAIVADDADRRMLLATLQAHCERHAVALHAYVLMDNHVHILATPDTVEGVPQAMQGVGRQYVRYFNQRHGRSGTLWEGRYRSNLIQTERYLLACMVYIDLNPVRAGMVHDAADYPWSSHAHYCGRVSDKLVTPHPLYWALGNTPFAREAAYRALVQDGLSRDAQHALSDSAVRGWALGDAGFLTALQERTVRRVEKARAGRPPRNLSPIREGKVDPAIELESDPN